MAINKCSKRGPRVKTGKKVSAPVIITTVTSMATKSGLAVGKVAIFSGTVFLEANEPAIARAGIIVANLPTSIARAVERL